MQMNTMNFLVNNFPSLTTNDWFLFHDRRLLTVLNLKLPYAAHCWFPAYFGLVPSRGFAKTSSGCASSMSSRSFRTNSSSPWRRTLTTLLSFFLLKANPPSVRGHQQSVQAHVRADSSRIRCHHDAFRRILCGILRNHAYK